MTFVLNLNPSVCHDRDLAKVRAACTLISSCEGQACYFQASASLHMLLEAEHKLHRQLKALFVQRNERKAMQGNGVCTGRGCQPLPGIPCTGQQSLCSRAALPEHVKSQRTTHAARKSRMSFLSALRLGSKNNLSLSAKLSDPEEALLPKEKCVLQQLLWLLSIMPVV